MQLSAQAVNWNNFKDVVCSGQFMDILFEEVGYENELLFSDTPWASDSMVQYMEVAEQLLDLPKPNEGIGIVASNLINQDYLFPNELEYEVDPELIAGSISPVSVELYNDIFKQIDMAELSNSVAEYLKQWGDYFNLHTKIMPVFIFIWAEFTCLIICKEIFQRHITINCN